MNRDENLAILREWVQEINDETGENLEITDAAPQVPNVNTKPAEDVAESVDKPAPKRKKPALRVIEGGAKAIDNASLPTLSDMPTPGGIALLLAIVLFILFAVVPTSNGRTRLSVMWAAFLGNAVMGQGSGTPDNSGAAHSGQSVTQSVTGVPAFTGTDTYTLSGIGSLYHGGPLG